MRPNHEESDMEYYTEGQQFWAVRAEEYFLLTASNDPETAAWAAEQEARCRSRLFVVELLHQESRGDIVVYTGRKAPAWAS